MNNQTVCCFPSCKNNDLQTALKILIVEDNDALRDSLCYMLKRYGHRVTACANATEALLQSMMTEFHYIITDFSMPGMNGVELVRRLRKKFPYTVIIGMSADDVGVQFLNAGANDFLLKPFAPHSLVMMIEGNEGGPRDHE